MRRRFRHLRFLTKKLLLICEVSVSKRVKLARFDCEVDTLNHGQTADVRRRRFLNLRLLDK